MIARKTPIKKRNKIIMTTTMSPAVHAELAAMAQATGVPQNSLIEQALLLLFSHQGAQNNNATSSQEVALV